jgi:hypothetical protein
MSSLFAVVLVLIAIAAIASQFLFSLRALRNAESRPFARNPVSGVADRYRPMLRLLSEDDLNFLAGDATTLRALRTERRKIFRGYLACLTKDYASLLAGVRTVMVQSGVDRPDLARALARNRALFAMAICKLEIRLALHWAGVGKVDVAGLVGAFDALRQQVVSFTAVPTVA